jgi:nitroreductase
MPSLYSIRTFPLRLWRRIIAPFARITGAAGGKSGFWASVHYSTLSPVFKREQRAVLAGHAAYRRSLHAPAGTLARLRRNVHRLEKGILMKPRRVPFALDYIGDTVEAFATAVGAPPGTMDEAEVAWANDVLSEYFDVHAGVPEVDVWRRQFHGVCFRLSEPAPRVPYLRDLESPPSVAFDDLKRLAIRRRSVRWFLPRRVEREKIDKALEVGAQAPTACNRQPFRFQILDEPALVQKAIDIPMGLAGYGHQVPVVAVVIGQQRHFFDERDRHLIYVDASLAVMGFLLALETLGLASCCVNWPDIENKEIRMAELLHLDPDERPVMLVAIGYPDPEGLVANSTKKSLSQLRTYNFE